MNISLEVRPSAAEATMMKKAPRSSRRMSLPDYSSLIIPMKAKPKKIKEPIAKRLPYEFEKVNNAPVDTPEDKAIKFQFKPKREYLPSQRRSSLPTSTKTEKMSASNHIKLARRSMPIAAGRRLQDSALSPFERQRKKDEMEEGALYSATRATERVTQSWPWKRKTIDVLGPLGQVKNETKEVVQEEPEPSLQAQKKPEDRKQQRRESLMALLEKDANKYNARLCSFSDLSISSSMSKGGSLVEPNPANESSATTGDNGYKLPYQISPQALKEMQLHEVFKKQNAEKKRRSQLEKKERNIEAAKKSPTKQREDEEGGEDGGHQKESQPRQKSSKESLRQEQLRMLKNALKEAAAVASCQEAALMDNSKHNRRQSMPSTAKHMAAERDATTSKEQDKLLKKTGGKGSRRSSMSALVPGVEKSGFYDWALAAKKQKENSRLSNGSQWKHIKSDSNAVRRSPDERILPLKPSHGFGNANYLPKLEALMPMVQTKLREETVV